jgi:hypothetical protein
MKFRKVTQLYRQGYGLLEVIISSFLFAIVVAGGAAFFVYFLRNYDFSFEETRIINDAEATMRRIAKEVREARTSENGAYALFTANDQEIGFYSDIDNDDVVEKVRYYLDGSNLYRTIVEPEGSPLSYDDIDEEVSLVSEHLTNNSDPVFYYYNEDWPGDEINNPLILTNRLSETRLVQIEIKVNTEEGLGVSDFIFSTEVMIRNLKTN